MKIYLDTNIFYNAYCPVENNEVADWILSQLDLQNQGITSEWTILEMFRALKKQVNLKTIAEKDAKTVIDFFLSEMGEMSDTDHLQILPITRSMIISSRKHIFTHNLYAADALHTTVAISAQVDCFLTFDGDFKLDLGNIKILNPVDPEFKAKFKRYLS